MAITRQERIFLSEQFRNYCSNLPINALRELENTLLTTFQVKNIRNVQLWTRSGVQTRNFLPTNSSSSEFLQRYNLCKAILDQRPISFPVKIADLRGNAISKGNSLRDYLTDPYFVGYDFLGGALFKIQVGTKGEIIIIYLADSNNDDAPIDIDASDSDDDDIEFNDIFEL